MHGKYPKTVSVIVSLPESISIQPVTFCFADRRIRLRGWMASLIAFATSDRFETSLCRRLDSDLIRTRFAESSFAPMLFGVRHPTIDARYAHIQVNMRNTLGFRFILKTPCQAHLPPRVVLSVV